MILPFLAVLLAVFFPITAEAGFFPDSPFSDSASGLTSAGFLKLPSSARAEALGGTYSAAADNSEAIFWNPAGIAQLGRKGVADLSLSHNVLLDGGYLSSMGFAKPFSWGVLGTGVQYFTPGKVEGFNSVGDPTSNFTPNDFAFEVSAAKAFDFTMVGGGLKVIRSDLGEASAVTAAVDLGVQALGVTDVGDGPLDVGLSLMNLGPGLKIGSQTDPLPVKFQGGVLWHISPQVNGLFDAHIPVDDEPYMSVGAEGWQEIGTEVQASLRGGYNLKQQREVDGLAGMAAGAGLRFRSFRFDYAWVPFGDLGVTHRISLGMMFGTPRPDTTPRRVRPERKKLPRPSSSVW